jgi:hypothetical protein
MRYRPMDNPVPRHLGHGEAHRRKMAVDVILERLHSPKAESDPRKVSDLLGRAQRLNAQPWRRPRRPGAESASTMELIRRFEAHLKAH